MNVEENDVNAVNPDAVCEGVQPPRCQQANKLFNFPDESQLSSSGDEFGFYVNAHEQEWANILNSIQNFLVYGTPLPEYITKLNLNIANASMEYVYYRNQDGSYTKSKTKILDFKITWCRT